jgi:NAD(P)-dependent dehydrogenase (short-subunit alcohol dehydrogenase family)
VEQRNNKIMEKKTCIITGSNAGIGKAAAIQIAAKGYHVIIGCRNLDRGKIAVEEIKSASKSIDVEMVLLDLASKDSIASAATMIQSKIDHLDVLIHNAADFDISRKKPERSPDGIETVWATNHLGPVLLTKLLMENLKKSSQGRIITIASKGLVFHSGLKIDLYDPEFKNHKFSVSKAYYQSKLAQVMYTYWLKDELSDSKVTANCIRVTAVKIDISRYPNISNFGKFIYNLKSKSSISANKMAETYTYLATDPSLENSSGNYYDEKNKIVASSKYSRNKENISQLMALTKKYL